MDRGAVIRRELRVVKLFPPGVAPPAPYRVEVSIAPSPIMMKSNSSLFSLVLVNDTAEDLRYGVLQRVRIVPTGSDALGRLPEAFDDQTLMGPLGGQPWVLGARSRQGFDFHLYPPAGTLDRRLRALRGASAWPSDSELRQYAGNWGYSWCLVRDGRTIDGITFPVGECSREVFVTVVPPVAPPRTHISGRLRL